GCAHIRGRRDRRAPAAGGGAGGGASAGGPGGAGVVARRCPLGAGKALVRPPPSGVAMKPAAFDYHAPRTLEEAVGLMAALDNAKVLAGGQSLVPMMNFRYGIVDHLVDLAQVQGLRGVSLAHGPLPL